MGIMNMGIEAIAGCKSDVKKTKQHNSKIGKSENEKYLHKL